PLILNRAGEQFALAVGFGCTRRDPALDVADECLEPGEDLGFGNVGGDRIGVAGSARLAHGSADVCAPSGHSARVQGPSALAAEADAAKQVLLDRAASTAAPLRGDRVEAAQAGDDPLPTLRLDQRLVVAEQPFAVGREPAGA